MMLLLHTNKKTSRLFFMPQIIPSIFALDKQTFFDQVRMIDGVVDMFQLDVADGEFVPTTTWADPALVSEINPDMKIELHLMTQHPIAEMNRWTNVTQVKRVLFPYESMDDIELCIDAAMTNGWQPCLVLNPETSIDAIAPYAEYLFGVMLMGVRPGAQGQAYISETTDRLREVHQRFPHLFLSVDGGVNRDTLLHIIPTGVDAVCPGSAIFGSGNPAENLHAMREIIHTYQGNG